MKLTKRGRPRCWSARMRRKKRQNRGLCGATGCTIVACVPGVVWYDVGMLSEGNSYAEYGLGMVWYAMLWYSKGKDTLKELR